MVFLIALPVGGQLARLQFQNAGILALAAQAKLEVGSRPLSVVGQWLILKARLRGTLVLDGLRFVAVA